MGKNKYATLWENELQGIIKILPKAKIQLKEEFNKVGKRHKSGYDFTLD